MAAGVEATGVEAMVVVAMAATMEDMAAMEAIVGLAAETVAASAADLVMLMAEATDAGLASSAGGHAPIQAAVSGPTEDQCKACAWAMDHPIQTFGS